MTNRPLSRSRHSLRRPAGSAYLVVLLALFIFSSIGLSLVLITETESLVGSSEKTIQRTFYAADSGTGASTAKALALSDYEAASYELRDDDVAVLLDIRHEVQVTPFVPILSAPCNLCEVNAAGTAHRYGEKTYWKITHGVGSEATRRGGPDGMPLSQATISSMVDVEPWEDVAESLVPLMDEEAIAKLTF